MSTHVAKFEVDLHYTIRVDVEAGDEDEAQDLAEELVFQHMCLPLEVAVELVDWNVFLVEEDNV